MTDKGQKYPAQSSIRVIDLIPGDVVTIPITGESAVFVGRLQHPLYTEFQMVIWRMGNPYGNRGVWHHDALSKEQVVGNTWTTSDKEREEALRWALKS